jgi:hypothetical protein
MRISEADIERILLGAAFDAFEWLAQRGWRFPAGGPPVAPPAPGLREQRVTQAVEALLRSCASTDAEVPPPTDTLTRKGLLREFAALPEDATEDEVLRLWRSLSNWDK